MNERDRRLHGALWALIDAHRDSPSDEVHQVLLEMRELLLEHARERADVPVPEPRPGTLEFDMEYP